LAHSERLARSRPKFRAQEVWQHELSALMNRSRDA
jgi:hypothetical protein